MVVMVMVIVLFLAEFEKVLNDVHRVFIRTKSATRRNHERLTSIVLVVLMIMNCVNFLGCARYSIRNYRSPHACARSKVFFVENCCSRMDFIGLLANY